MDSAALAQALWADIGAQRWDALAAYFLPGALIFWHNTDECFTAEEFVRANREYPGNWRIEIERVHALADAAATAVRSGWNFFPRRVIFYVPARKNRPPG